MNGRFGCVKRKKKNRFRWKKNPIHFTDKSHTSEKKTVKWKKNFYLIHWIEFCQIQLSISHTPANQTIETKQMRSRLSFNLVKNWLLFFLFVLLFVDFIIFFFWPYRSNEKTTFHFIIIFISIQSMFVGVFAI